MAVFLVYDLGNFWAGSEQLSIAMVQLLLFHSACQFPMCVKQSFPFVVVPHIQLPVAFEARVGSRHHNWQPFIDFSNTDSSSSFQTLFKQSLEVRELRVLATQNIALLDLCLKVRNEFAPAVDPTI